MRGDVLCVNDAAATDDGGSASVDVLGRGPLLEALRLTERVAGGNRIVQNFPGSGQRRSVRPLVFREDRYFVLGDDRDNSIDSRVFGSVPRASLIGPAERVLVSVDVNSGWLPRVGRTVAPLR